MPKRLPYKMHRPNNPELLSPLENCLVEKEGELEKLTKLLDASTKKIERKKRKVRAFQLHNFYIISASL